MDLLNGGEIRWAGDVDRRILNSAGSGFDFEILSGEVYDYLINNVSEFEVTASTINLRNNTLIVGTGIIEFTSADTTITLVSNDIEFDFVFFCINRKSIVVEINYKHKEKAARKWHNVFIPLLINSGFDYLTINDYDCRKRGLFYLDGDQQHEQITWEDFRDVIDALEMAGMAPNGNTK